MLIRGTTVFLQRSEEFAQRVLHPAAVVRFTERGFLLELEAAIALRAGQDLHLYCEVERQFMQQPVRIVSVEMLEGEGLEPDVETITGRVVVIETTGTFVSAECRACYRIGTLTAELQATLDHEKACPLTDVSPTGFSVLADAKHEIGTVVPATLWFEDKEYRGEARVQSLKSLITGRTRYGVHSLEVRGAAATLEHGQQLIGAAVQREQLSRRNGD